MKRLTLFIFLTVSSILTFAQHESDDNRIGFNLNKPEHEEWLRNQGFGMFVHWSVDSQLGIVISHSLVGASDDYCKRFFNDLPKTFNPYLFNPKQWAVLAKLAGMKYIVFTTKHHSGFCMWDTKTTDFNIMNTPYRKDLLREYVDAVREAGLAVGFYYSPEDFKFLYDNGVLIQRRGIKYTSEFMKKYEAFIEAQCKELFTNYGRIDILFIDGEPKAPAKYTGWKLQPDLIITRGAVNTPEQSLPGLASDKLWESCITMGTQWHYKPTNDELKNGTRLLEILIETRAKGGNLLLNIGPHPDGYIPKEQEERLREIAAWNFINYEGIQNVRHWIVTNEDNIWYTRSLDGKTVYAFLTNMPNWPKGERRDFVLHSVKSTPETKISVLSQNDQVVEYTKIIPDSRFEQQEDGLKISVVRAQRIYNNNKWPNPITVKLENVVPALDPPVVQTLGAEKSSGKVILKGKLVKGDGSVKLQVGFEYRPYAGFTEALNVSDWNITKTISMDKESDYSVEVEAPQGKVYEYRAVVIHPKMKISGDIKQF